MTWIFDHWTFGVFVVYFFCDMMWKDVQECRITELESRIHILEGMV